MSQIKQLRERLGVTQESMGNAIGVSQANVSFYEKGTQQMPPLVARRLIQYAHDLGHAITFDDIYGPLPDLPPRKRADRRRKATDRRRTDKKSG